MNTERKANIVFKYIPQDVSISAKNLAKTINPKKGNNENNNIEYGILFL